MMPDASFVSSVFVQFDKKSGFNIPSLLVSPRFFPALSLAFFFVRAPLSERLEQAKYTQLE